MTDRLAAAEALLADLVGFASISGQPNGEIVYRKHANHG